MRNWQVLHITGPTKESDMAAAYAQLGVPAQVMPFCDTMGLAWGAATVAISRSGAGSVAEAWANAVPTIFLPYPFHKDDHQRLNAGPIVAAGGAVLLKDLVDAPANASQLAAPMLELVCGEAKREAMAAALRATTPIDGAEAVAQWVREVVKR
jgi:UDP-N-acetylglucosamine--N-acetylmuramyl-(pentapeptide) pyrophosphoryl-undecaprenol N-acetylglucosamine transferase